MEIYQTLMKELLFGIMMNGIYKDELIEVLGTMFKILLLMVL